MYLKNKIFEIAIVVAGATLGLANAQTGSNAVPNPAIAWDFQHIQNGQVSDNAGKPSGKLENATSGLLDTAHAYVSVSKDPSSRVTLQLPKMSNKHLTISLWVNISKGSTSFHIMRGSTFSLGVYRQNAKMQYRSGTKFNDLNTYPDARGIIGNGQWHHLAASYDESAGGKAVIYVDGVQVAEATADDAPSKGSDSDSKIEIGSLPPKSMYAGSMAEIRIFDAVLSPDQVRSIYDADKDAFGKHPADASTVKPKAQTADAATSTASASDESDDMDLESGKLVTGSIDPADQALHAAWLDYRPAAPGAINGDESKLLQNVVASQSDPTIHTAADELDRAITAIAGIKPGNSTDATGAAGIILGTPGTSQLIANLADPSQLKQAGDQGYVLESVKNGGTPYLIVGANSPSGVIAGTFALIRRMQLGQPFLDLNIVDAPKTSIRLVNHWDFIPDSSDGSQKGRNNSIFNWADLRSGHTAEIHDWIRLLASAGYNAICPTELNWAEGNNFLTHTQEIRNLGDICRDYGVKLYWTPNCLLAPLPSTADTIYAAVPDFGGYLLKFGSEGQPGDPGPKTINEIARLLAPHGGNVLVRGFIYGKYSPIQDKLRVVIPYKFFGSNDGQYDKNVVIVGKSCPLDFEIREPINPLDGVLKQTRYGTEMMIGKDFPMSWLASWKRWFDFDNQRNGPGTFNENGIDAVVGVAMIHPNVSWTDNPLNMINYYGLGRLAWNPTLTSAQIRSEWIDMTFGPQSTAAPVVDGILTSSETFADDLMLYHGYRGVWVIIKEGDLRPKLPYPQQITRDGIGGDGIGTGLSAAYAPAVKAFYEDEKKNEDLLLFFHFLPYDYRLTNGRTLAEDMHDRLGEGVDGAKEMLAQWKTLDGKIDPKFFTYTTECFESYVTDAQKQQKKIEGGFTTLLGHPLWGENHTASNEN